MELSFKKYLEQIVPGVHNDGPGGGFAQPSNAGSYLTSDQAGSEQHKNDIPFLPSYELTVQTTPTTVTHGVIAKIDWASKNRRSVIGIRIKSNNNRAEDVSLTRDQYDKMREMNQGRHPRVGDNISVTFQRHPSDRRQKKIDGSINSSTVLGIKY